jgi:hypothetical protein
MKSTRLTRLLLSIGLISILLFASCADLARAASTQTEEAAEAAAPAQGLYATGNPTLRDIWVDPVNGNDANDGATPSTAFRTLDAAWNDIPMNVTLSEGVRVNLQPGSYPEASIPVYLEARHGTFAAPIWIKGNGTRGQIVLLGDLNIYDARYLYIESLTINVNGDVLHCELCDHLLLRNVKFDGGGDAHETIKVNQSQYLYIENSDLSGAYENVIDYVAVQYGHIMKNKIYDGDDWCAYVKGGSAYIRVEGNTIYNCGTGGFTTGQGTGFEYMVSPWLHYEAYDIKFVNNIIHDTEGACFGVNGGYNILMAYNTCYRVGSRSHVIEVVFGGRSCDGNTAQCGANRSAGGWGTSVVGGDEPIPDRNVYIYNNIVYNPPGFQSAWQHFAIYGPRTPAGNSNIPNPARTDTNLKIRGNIIWNGPVDHALGVEDPSQGCRPSNAACNETQLRADNAINTIQPQLVNPAGGDFHPLAGGNVFSAATYAIPNFAWSDAPTPPTVPQGTLSNAVNVDFANTPRTATNPPGAYFSGSSATPGGLTVRSEGANDGHALESAETSSTGGTVNRTATTLNVGDDASDRQYRGVLSFDTSALPDNAVITKVTLKVRYQSAVGADAFASHGALTVDVRKGDFGGAASLDVGDFQAAATKNAVGTIPSTRVNNWHTRVWTSGILTYINKTGRTQFRLRFATDDNDDGGADFIRFYSGNDTTLSYRPTLVIEYYVP